MQKKSSGVHRGARHVYTMLTIKTPRRSRLSPRRRRYPILEPKFYKKELAMSELGGAYYLAAPCRQRLLPCSTSRRSQWGCPKQRRFLRCPAATHRETAGKGASTYTARIATDIPLYESPGASFDQYLEDKPRVFRAIFPDKPRSQQLNEEEWRIQMLPIQFLFLTVWPVIDMRLRCKSRGRDYPPLIPQDVSKVLELDITRWELQGLDSVLEPSHFALGVKGALYPDRRGMRSRLKGQLEMSISFVLPPMLSLVPADVLQSVAESVLTRLVENMKHKVNGSLLEDYSKFKREQPRQLI